MSWRFVDSNRNYKQGYYTPEHPEKYLGDKNNIFFRSSWELHLMVFFDRNEKIEKWSSEPFPINYFYPMDKKIHKYFIDFWALIDSKKVLIEVKPKAETQPPKRLNEKSKSLKKIKNYNDGCLTYIKNISKWKAAKELCDRNGWNFLIITEDDFKKLKISI